MKIHSPLFLLGALGVLSAAGSAAAQADTSAWTCSACPYPKGTSGVVDAGLAYVSDASARFGDFSGLQRDGARLVLGGALRYRGPSGYFADVWAGDRDLAARSGREGLYTLRLGYAETPRHFADDAQSPFLGSSGAVLTLPAGFPAGTTAAMPLASTLQPVELGFKHSRLDLGLSGAASPRWTYRLTARHDVRDGTRRGAASFFSTTTQLALPVDEVTDQLEASLSYAGRRLQASLGYQVSQFRNGHTALRWANPFTPVFAGATAGQLTLTPDNSFQQVFGSAGYVISPKIRASADFAIGRMTQDAAYLAPTLNAGLPVTLASLPALSLDGRVDTFNGSLRITANPTEQWRVNASYARDVRDNRTARLAYPAVSTDMFVGSLPRSNQPFDVTQDRFKLSGDWRGPASVKASLGVEHDNRQRNYQEVVDTRETTLWGRIGLQPRENLSLALKLAHAQRDPSVYGTSVWIDSPQNPLLRKFNLAERQRDSAGLRADLTVSEKVSLGLALDVANDDYGQSVIGLTDARSANLGVDLSVALSERTQLQLFAQGERIRSQQAGSQTFAAADWRARTTDRVEVLGLGIKHAAIVDKLDIGADIAFTRSKSDVAVDNGVGGPQFPRASSALDSIKLFATYKLRDNLWLAGSFWYEEYSAQDWHLDGVLPATVSSLLAFGEQPPRYRVNVLRLVLRHRF